MGQKVLLYLRTRNAKALFTVLLYDLNCQMFITLSGQQAKLNIALAWYRTSTYWLMVELIS